MTQPMRRTLLAIVALCLAGAGCTSSQTTNTQPQVAGAQDTATSTRYADRQSYVVTLSPKDGKGSLTLVRTGNNLRGRSRDLFGKPSGELFGIVDEDGWQTLQWQDDAGGLPMDIRAAWTPEDVWWTSLDQPDGSQTRIELVPKQAPESVELEPVVIEKKEAPFAEARCEFSLAYPKIVSGVPQDRMEAMNALIQQAAAGTSTEQGADTFIELCRQELQDLSKMDPPSQNLTRFETRTFSIETNQDGILSLGFHLDGYYGGAHPLHGSVYLTLDTRTGKRLTITDLIAPDKLRMFFQAEKFKLLSERRDSLFEDQQQEFTRFVETIASPSTKEQVESYGGFSNFYLTPQALVTEYDEYEVAPYAAGPIRVFLPYANIASFFSSESVIKRLIQK